MIEDLKCKQNRRLNGRIELMTSSANLLKSRIDLKSQKANACKLNSLYAHLPFFFRIEELKGEQNRRLQMQIDLKDEWNLRLKMKIDLKGEQN